jgi:hypothetical protein
MTLRLRGGGGCGTCVSGGCGSKASGSNVDDPDDDEAAELADAVLKASSESEVAIEEASTCNVLAQQEVAAAKERRIRNMASDGLTIFSFKSFLDWFINEWLSTYLRSWYLPIFEALDADSSGRSVKQHSHFYLVYS